MSIPIHQADSTTDDETMFDEQQDYIRSLERPSVPASPLGASAFFEVSNEEGNQGMQTLEPVPEPELGFGERFSKEEEEVRHPPPSRILLLTTNLP